jgi:formylglycine-generating enzyme
MVATAVLCSFAGWEAPPARGIDLAWVNVGDPGNVADVAHPLSGLGDRRFGAVASPYRIMQFEFTTANYASFLNAVDPLGVNPNSVVHPFHLQYGGIQNTGTVNGARYSVQPGRENLPVAASWFQAARVANWLHNGQGNGSTESGAYALNGQITGISPLAGPSALYSIPTVDQWYKAAHYKGGGTDAGYWLYPTRSDSQPSPVTVDPVTKNGSAGTTGNFANGGGGWWNNQMHGTKSNVGTNGGPSPYGAFDMGGNSLEWTERFADDPYYTSPWQKGASYGMTFTPMASYYFMGSPAGSPPYNDYGFRLVSKAYAYDSVGSGTVIASSGQPVAVGVANGGEINATAGSAQIGTLSGATLNTGSAGATVTTLSSGTINTSGGTVTTQGGTFTGTVTGSGGLSMNGSGTLVLDSANTYGGGTFISSGTVEIARGDAIGSAPIRIANNGKFRAIAGVAVTNTVVAASPAATYEHVLGASDLITNLAPITNGSAVADIVAGDSAATTVTSSFNANGSISLEGLNGTKFLMVLNLDGYIPQDATPATYYLGWWNEAANGGAGAWVNAVEGNLDPAGDLAGSYTMGYAAFLSANGPWNGTTMLGAYGLDVVNQQVWAVIDHNSDFGVTNNGILMVPEPGTLVLAGLGLVGIALRFRRRRAA